jgi:hypothetical protein
MGLERCTGSSFGEKSWSRRSDHFLCCDKGLRLNSLNNFSIFMFSSCWCLPKPFLRSTSPVYL